MTAFMDHVTYQVHHNDLEHPELARFFSLFGFTEISALHDILEKGWNVRWFADAFDSEGSRTVIHLVGADSRVPLELSHFCVVGIGEGLYRCCAESEFVEHNSNLPVGSKLRRLWLCGPGGLRVEVRP